MLLNRSLHQFQFHKGTINPMTPVNLRKNIINFNSIKVRLTPFSPNFIFFVGKFQFHKGTINPPIQTVVSGFFDISIP